MVMTVCGRSPHLEFGKAKKMITFDTDESDLLVNHTTVDHSQRRKRRRRTAVNLILIEYMLDVSLEFTGNNPAMACM